MAKPDSTQPRGHAPNTRNKAAPTAYLPDRFLTVKDVPEPHPTKTLLRINGAWLKKAGFIAQTRVRVRVMPGCLVITAQD